MAINNDGWEDVPSINSGQNNNKISSNDGWEDAPEVNIEPMKDIHTQFKETLDKGLEAINSKFDESIKTISEDNTMDADIKDTMLKNLEYKKKQAEDNMYIDNAKKLKSMGVNRPKLEEDKLIAGDKPLETPELSPEFAIGGVLSKLGVAKSVIGDVGATLGTKGFEGLTEMLTPKLKEEHPIAYTVLGLASALAGGSIANTTRETTLGKINLDLSPEAVTVGKTLGLSEEQMKQLTLGVKRSDQALELAKIGGGKTVGYMEKGLAESEKAKSGYLDELTAKTEAIKKTVGSADFEKVKKATQEQYDAIKKVADSLSSNTYDASSFIPELENLKKVGSKSVLADRRIENMIERINDNPNQSVGDLIQLRADINYELNKADDSVVGKWKLFKDDLTGFLKENLDGKTFNLVEKSKDSWKRMKQQEEMVNLINDAQVSLGAGTKAGGEVSAIDWNKLSNSLKEAKLDSPEAQEAIKLSKQFQDKFGDMDLALFNKALPKGEREIIQTNSPSFTGALKVVANRGFVSWFLRQFSDDKLAQKAIGDAMEKSNSKAEFLRNIIENKNTPERVKEETKTLTEGFDLSNTNINQNKMLSEKTMRDARNIQIDVNKKDLALSKAENNLVNIEDSIGRMENRKSELERYGRNTSDIEAMISKLERRREDALKDIDIKEQVHSEAKSKYDKVQLEIEKLDMFRDMRSGARKPDVKAKQGD